MRGRATGPVKIEMRICLAYAFLDRQFADNRRVDGDIRDIAGGVKTILHQCADRAVVVLVKVVVMVLGD